MADVRRVFSRKTLTVASQPAAWEAVLAQQAWRLKGPSPPAGGVPAVDDAPAAIHWPTTYRHPTAASFVEPLRAGFGILTAVESRPIPQPYTGIVLFEIRYLTDTIPVAVDYYDYKPINQECLERVPLYFKMQYRRSGYDDPRILPGGYIAGKQALYDYYSHLRKLRHRSHTSDVYARFGTFNTRSSNTIRRQAVALLEHDGRFEFAGGTSLALYMQYLREAARARVCIDMPGNGPFCFRLVEYLAMGCCVVAPRHATMMHADLRDREHIVYCRDDLSDLADLCMHYVENHEARETVAANAARFFDEHLHPAQLASHYLRVLSERLRSSPAATG
jgi:hypothetical protein